MTIITSQEQFNERLHRAKLDVVQWRVTTGSFKDIIENIKLKKINKNLCIK